MNGLTNPVATITPLLPKSVVLKHGSIYYLSNDKLTGKNKWHRLGSTWDAVAKKQWALLVVRHRTGVHAQRLLYGDDGGGPIPLKFLKEQLVNARKNAKSRNLECTLTLDDIKNLAEKSQGRCSLTGIKFEFGASKELFGTLVRRKRVWAPSLDRLDGFKGYTPDNVRLVCMAVNIARQEFGDAVLLKMARALSNIQCLKKKAKIKVQ